MMSCANKYKKNVKQMILGVLMKNLKAIEKKRKDYQYIGKDDEMKEISSKDK
jgi:hypothetical protein